MKEWFKEHRGLIGYVVLAIGIVFAVWLAQEQSHDADRKIREEARLREEFDERRAFDICVSGNERTEIISEAIKGVAQDSAEALITAAARADDEPMTPEEAAEQEEVLTFYREDVKRRAEKRLETLKPRNCEALYPKKGR